ncbi:MAG TPA: phosphate signaling complex protein PhoU [Candidatus Dormibacteraeota bacterium]|nr:phosphate signaling complex protein PhoU [Candidatus Dormibacteraeota bacterium]
MASAPSQDFDADLAALRDGVRVLGGMVAEGVASAMTGLEHRDGDRLRAVVAGDVEVNERHRQERERGLAVLAAQHPTGNELNEVFALLLMASELERMGDHAKSCARYALPLIELSSRPRLETILRMGRYVEEQVRDIMEAVTANDYRRAQDIAARDDRIDRIYHRVFDDMVETMREHPEWAYPGANLLFIAHNLERIADRVTNIAEDVVFLATGRLTELG